MSNQYNNNIQILQILKAHTSDVTCAEFYGNSLLVTGSSDKTVRIWRWISGSGFIEEAFSPLLHHKYGVTSVKISPQGGVLASSSVDGSVILWDLNNGIKTDIIQQEAGEAVRACAFSPDGAYIVSSDDSGAFCVWGHNKNLVRLKKSHEETVHTLAFSSDSTILLTACTLGNVRLFLFNEHVNENFDYACAIDCAHDLGVLSADFCKLVHTDPADNDITIYTVATCGQDHTIKLWRIFVMFKLKAEGTKSRLLPSCPHEHLSGVSTIYCTERMNTECVLTIQAHGSSVTCVKFNRPGTLLLSSSLDKTVKLWDLHGVCLKTLGDHSRYVNCVTINNDSSIIASGSNDRSVIVWDLTNSYNLESHITGVRSLIFNLATNQNDIPLEFMCPITHELMINPATAADGFTYERLAILEWFNMGRNTSPMTNAILDTTVVIDNFELKEKIDDFLKALDFDPFT